MQHLRHKVSHTNDISLPECQALLAVQQLNNVGNCWIITDGKAGDQNPCIGIASSLGLSYTIKHVSPRPFYAALAPYYADPAEFVDKFQAPYPDIVIASGRRAVPVMRAIKRAAPSVFCVFLKDPRCSNSGADFIWQPDHDGNFRRGATTSLLSPHHIQLCRSQKSDHSKILGVLVGGNSAHTHWSRTDIQEFLRILNIHAQDNSISLHITTSRRTPNELRTALANQFEDSRHQLWSPDSEKINPYVDILSSAHALLVTADSINMMSEALLSGAPVFLFEPTIKPGRIRRHISSLVAQHLVYPATSALHFERGTGYNVTPALAGRIANAYLNFKGHIE